MKTLALTLTKMVMQLQNEFLTKISSSTAASREQSQPKAVKLISRKQRLKHHKLKLK
jgi:hypothetical protein